MATKIIGLQIENLRKIRTAEMQFSESGLIQFKGENGQGKTTVLDALMILFQGDKAKVDDMVTHGEKKAKITVDLGAYTAEKVFDNDKSKLSITEKATNQPVKNPQDFLKAMVNQISFNPFNFLNKTPLEKHKDLMKLLKIDFTEINKKLEITEKERTVVGREIDRFGVIDPVNPAEKVSIKELYEEKKIVEDENRQIRADYQNKFALESEKVSKYQSELGAFERTKKDLTDQVVKIQSQKDRNLLEIKRLQAENNQLTMQMIEIEDKRDALAAPVEPVVCEIPEPVYKSTAYIDSQIENAESINIKAHDYANYLEKRAEKQKLKDQYEDLTSEVEKLRAEKLKILAETPTGVPGLVITEEAVIHNGSTSENWSDAQGIDVACKLCIAQNPELKAVFIDKGESFDKKRLAALQDWAEKNDLQAFITVVDEVPENLEAGAFYVVEGEIITK